MTAPQQPADLAAHRSSASRQARRRAGGLPGRHRGRSTSSRVTVNSALMQRQLALAGGGIALLPEFAVASDLRSGALKRVLADYRLVSDGVAVSLVYPGREFLPGKVRAFVDLAAERFRLPSVSMLRAVAARPDMTVATAAAA
jgi:DNA-binding transcriptional LysR family regulator